MTVVAEERRSSPPYEAYAAIAGVFVGGLGAAGLAARVFDRNPACQSVLDLVVLSAASFKAFFTSRAMSFSSWAGLLFSSSHC